VFLSDISNKESSPCIFKKGDMFFNYHNFSQ
jgi:hypothetical protein